MGQVVAKQKYEWGWVSRFVDGGEDYEEGEGYPSKAAVLVDISEARAEERRSIDEGFQNRDTQVRYTIRKRPVFEIPPWEEVPG